MGRRGEITVFLSMCFLCIGALLCVMIESARTAGSRYYFQVAVNGGLDVLLSRYHRRLWEEYRILALEYESEEELSDQLELYVNRYLEADNWYPMELEAVDVTGLQSISQENGDYLAEEIVSYMKYGVVSHFTIQPEEADQLRKDVKEALGTGALTGMYSGQEKEVRKLEQAVEDLADNIRQQERYKEEAKETLMSDDEDGFYSAAGKYKKAAQNYPRLMKQYRKQADALSKKQRESRAEIHKIKPDLQENRGELLEKQWNPYDTYIEQDGERYREFSFQEQVSAGNLELMKETEELVEELLEYREEYEKNEEDDEEEEIWLEPAARMWDEQYKSSRINLGSGSGDKEKQKLLDQVQRMIQGGLLSLVMPEGSVISQTAVSSAGLPSEGLRQEGQKAGSLAEQVLVGEYCGYFFLNAVKGGEHELQYEMEYLLHGAGTDRENLEKTVTELFAVREGLNLIHILADSVKRDQARALALAITGSVGLAPLTEIVTYLVMGVWAMGETIQDLRTLMAGGKVPLWKKREDWNMSLEGLLDMGRGTLPRESAKDSSGKGFSYEGYLKLLLLKEDPAQKHMRILDLMQINIGRTQPGFLITNCAYRVDIHGKACGKHVFFALPIVENMIRGEKGYPLEAAAGKAY
ncbi:MAG: hypothetical protein HFG69_01615 [Hungatella sp.]|nr:hypothetical protein [Hungatella sp.]